MVKIENELGMISITSDVFMNIAGEAATNCFGVKGMGARSKPTGLFICSDVSQCLRVSVSASMMTEAFQ